MREIKSYTINGHVVVLLQDCVLSQPFFIVNVDGKTVGASRDRNRVVDVFDAACRSASPAAK